MKKVPKWGLTPLILFSFLEASSEEYKLGKKLYMEKACLSCHGAKAEGIHIYPRLANRAKGFLIYKLKRFRDGISDNQQQEMMIAFSTSLSNEEIDRLTTFMSDYVDEESGDSYDDSFETWGDGGS